jgi:hypothetical protein
VISRHFTRWQKVAALAPALLLLVCLPAQMMLRCRIDGLVRAACCCAPQDKQQPTGPTIEAQDCCDRVTANSDRPKADVARPAARDLASTGVLAVVIDVAPLVAPASRFDRAVHRYGPAREGPPLVLLKHAFLI